ncbi:septal ring lytic transglycosylase RlpA family protein [Falsiroseomonas tokyonensis]|uniref:Endolytic peptidoglycan transglycosylase RlpA n=1 Tax=Falsiroseomonas tokyonensis TaxID=430521 RepID=A0ABV7BZI7_9PROT|nr:septal ring lytic transglycosylase RlpA family protein [Falsiroseomonas tokyonensis]
MSGHRKWFFAVLGLACMGGAPAFGDEPAGRVLLGEASYYHPRFHGQRMANGERFDAQSDAAASRTLPFGTIARVTNLETGQTAQVRIADRGPHSRRRILDVSPRTARQLGMRNSGTARVRVVPIAVPQRAVAAPSGAVATRSSLILRQATAAPVPRAARSRARAAPRAAARASVRATPRAASPARASAAPRTAPRSRGRR